MKRDQIIEMAKQAGAPNSSESPSFVDFLELFAKLVAEREREACANVCEAYQDPFAGNAMADAIRART